MASGTSRDAATRAAPRSVSSTTIAPSAFTWSIAASVSKGNISAPELASEASRVNRTRMSMDTDAGMLPEYSNAQSVPSIPYEIGAHG